MSKKKTIVKRLDSIQSFGGMNILCTDKTGTLTKGILEVVDIINGDLKYIENIKKELSKIKENNFDIVYCYNIEYLNENREYFEKNYDGILNTKII